MGYLMMILTMLYVCLHELVAKDLLPQRKMFFFHVWFTSLLSPDTHQMKSML